MVRDKVVSFRNSVESESQHAVQSDAPVFEMGVYMTVQYKQLLLPCPDMSLQRDSQRTNRPPSAYQRYVVEQVKSKKDSALKSDLFNRPAVIGWLKSCQGSLLLAANIPPIPLSCLSVLCGSTFEHPFPPLTISSEEKDAGVAAQMHFVW
jgi:hypothetical protein